MNLALDDLKILLIEPSDTQRKIIQSLIENANVAEVQVASNVTEAKTLVSDLSCDIVASSMYLEDGTALDILNFMKQGETTESIPFMLVSSETSHAKLEDFKQAGIAAILPKPFSFEHLERALQATLSLINEEHLEMSDIDHEKMTVLIVDDSRMALKHIKRVLQNLGFIDFVECENGIEALSALEQRQVDLVVTDFNMPEMNGRELAERLHQSTAYQHLPIIMVTSEAGNSATMANIHQSGVDALCDKPFEPEHVRNIIHNLLTESR